MAATTTETGHAAFQHVFQNLDQLNGRVGATDTEALFLKGLMDSPVLKSLVKVQDRLEEKNGVPSPHPTTASSFQISSEVDELCSKVSSKEAKELGKILKKPHLQSLLKTQDTIARKQYDEDEVDSDHGFKMAPVELPPLQSDTDSIQETYRMVGLRKLPSEPLGITVRSENGNLVIARILGGGMIDRQGLLSVGDVIKEVNGTPVSTAEELTARVQEASDTVVLKLMPSFADAGTGSQVMPAYTDPMHAVCYMRALFNYNPVEDSLLPCPEIGLPFHQGDILEIVDQSDPNWWQARRVATSNVGGAPRSGTTAGLIPSQELEERRKAFVKPEYDYVHKTGICGTKISKKKRKQMYQTKSYSEFEKAELILYEEVVRSPPFQRKTLVLIGAPGVGRRTLKNKLITYDPSKFGSVIPFTSRPIREGEDDGKNYHFTSRIEMETDIIEHRYLEYGEHGGHLYGTKLDSIRQVIRSGRMCIIDCGPQSVKILHNSSEFMPYVVFIAAPGVEQLKFMNEYGRVMGHSSRSLTFDRALRYSSRRARTMESLATVYEDEDLRRTMEESARLQRAYDKYIDMVLVNEDFDSTFKKLMDALEVLSTDPQWVPVQWIY